MIDVWREPVRNAVLDLAVTIACAVIGCTIAARILRTLGVIVDG